MENKAVFSHVDFCWNFIKLIIACCHIMMRIWMVQFTIIHQVDTAALVADFVDILPLMLPF